MLLTGCESGPEKEPPSPSGTGTAGMMPTGGSGGTSGSASDTDLFGCGATLPAQIAACVHVMEGPRDTRTFTGVVQAIESPASVGCEVVIGNATGGNPRAEGHNLIISDGDVTMSIGVMLPFASPFVEVGDTVTVTQVANTPLESPDDGFVMLRDENDDLLFWIALSFMGLNAPDTLPPTEVVMRQGEATCMSGETSCGPITRGPIVASAGADEVSIDEGVMANVGDFVVVNGESVRARGCGWPIARTVVAVVRGSQESLSEDWQPDEDAGL